MLAQTPSRLGASRPGWVPSPLTLLDKLDPVTGPFAYVRLLGDRAEVDKLTETLDHVVIDRRRRYTQTRK